jgi:hypothetical protein
MQTTDAGQGGPYQDLSSPLVDVVSGVDLLSMKIGTGKLQANEFIQTVRAELDAAEYPMSSLDLQMIEMLANSLASSVPLENRDESSQVSPEFFRQREISNATGSGVALHKNEDSDSWMGNFIELVQSQGDCVYQEYWGSGGPGAGVDTEFIVYVLGRYWARSSFNGFSGPYEAFEDAFKQESFGYITGAVEQIWCNKMGRERTYITTDTRWRLDRTGANAGD